MKSFSKGLVFGTEGKKACAVLDRNWHIWWFCLVDIFWELFESYMYIL